MYKANNGILTAELTDEEAHAHFAAAEHVTGHFGGTFTTSITAETGMGQRVSVAATTYTPVHRAHIDDLEELADAAA